MQNDEKNNIDTNNTDAVDCDASINTKCFCWHKY